MAVLSFCPSRLKKHRFLTFGIRQERINRVPTYKINIIQQNTTEFYSEAEN